MIIPPSEILLLFSAHLYKYQNDNFSSSNLKGERRISQVGHTLMSLRSAKISLSTSPFTCNLREILSSQAQSVLQCLLFHVTYLYVLSACLLPASLLTYPHCVLPGDCLSPISNQQPASLQ